MSLKVIIAKGMGFLRINPSVRSRQDAYESGRPYLLGRLDCKDEHGNDSVTLEGAGWVKRKPSGEVYYSLSFGGIEASLYRVLPEDRPDEKYPDFTGNFAYGRLDRKMRLAGWSRVGNDDSPYMSIGLAEKQPVVDPDFQPPANEQPPPADGNQRNATQSQQGRPTKGKIPGFD